MVRALIIVIIVASRRPMLSQAQVPSPTPGQTLSVPADARRSNATVVVDQATLEQILARLDSAEAEIHALRQQQGDAAGQSDIPAASPAFGCASSTDDSCECDHAVSADHADSASYLIPLSTDCGDITFKPGLRLQPRYIYDDANNNDDFLIRRFRLKAGGSIFDSAWYGAELKIDSTGKFGTNRNPDASVENAWVDFTVWPESTFLRIGLYDIPFSRNALTSDAKLLLMDRTLIKEHLTGFGLTDNTIGLMLHGRPHGGRFEYYVGVFDNVEFELFADDVTRESDQLMPAGRLVVNFLDSAEPPQGYADYQESYIGKGQRLQLGVNAASLNEAIDTGFPSDIVAWGVDVFYNSGPWVAQGEFDWFQQDFFAGAANIQGEGWYVQAGYLINSCWELAARYQLLDPDTNTAGDQLRWTSIGLNYYIWEHNLKIQTDYTFKDEQGAELANNAFQVQLQLDY